MSYKSVNIEESGIKWVDEISRDGSADFIENSISSENDESGSDTEGNILRHKNAQDIWEEENIVNILQNLPGYGELVELINHDELFLLFQNEHSLTTGILIASYLGKVNILKELISLGASVHFSDQAGRTPIHFAANEGHADCVKLLLDKGANVNQWDGTHKITPLHCAACRGHLSCLRILIKFGADVNVALNKKTPLHYAVENLAVECVKELLENGATPNTLQVFSETPLHVAASLGSQEIIKLLLKYGASINVQCGPDKSTALHLAAEDGNLACVKLLIEGGANISALNHKKQTPLHIAALCQASESLELLLKKGANPNASDMDGRIPLHSAIVKVSRSLESVKMLLNAGANVNKPDAFGYTPLHLAALNEFSNCVLLLINYGGDVTARTNGGISVLTFITRRTPDVIPKYLSKFSNSIVLTDHEIGDVDCELKLDFKILVPCPAKGEMELFLNFIEVGHREVLNHPLCETFLFLKWRRIRKYFLFSLFYHSLYVLLFTFYTVGVFLRDCQSARRIDACRISPQIQIVGYLLITLNLMMLAKEVFQIAHSWFAYLKHWENWLQWMILTSVFCCVIPNSDDVQYAMHSWQHHVAGIGIFLTWVELMMIVGRFPIFGLYVQMFTRVAINFTKFVMAYICLLIAFALSFGVLFANYISFKNTLLGIMKVIIMMSGELEFEDIFYGDTKIIYPGTAHIMFLAFVLLVTIILTNLMVGLAVSDIQGLQQSAGLDRLVRQAELVAHLESMLFSRLLRCIPSKILAFFYKHALLLQSQQHSALYIRPNDPREERIPKDLIKSIYELVVERKDKHRRKQRNFQNFLNGGDMCGVSKMNSSYDYIYVRSANKMFPEYSNPHTK